MKKNAPTRITISEKKGNSYHLAPQDFIYFLNESLSELQYLPKHTLEYLEQREIFLETYFTFMHFAREFNWRTPKEIDKCKMIITEYMKDIVRERSNFIPFFFPDCWAK